jgi:hypothetical protein
LVSICSLTGILSPNRRCPSSIFLIAVQGSDFAFWIFRVQCVALQIQVSSSYTYEAIPLGLRAMSPRILFLVSAADFSVAARISEGTGSVLFVLVFGTSGSVPHFGFAAQFATFGRYSVFFALVSACGRCRRFNFRSW